MSYVRIRFSAAWWSPARTLSSLILGLAATSSARSHHPMGGMTPETSLQGLLSGLAHPVIGLDHMMFLIGAGVLVGLMALPRRKFVELALAFVLAGATGTLLHAGGLMLGGVELPIAVSLIVVGMGLWRQRVPATGVLAVLSLLAGLAHGYAFGEAVIGAEPTPLGAYLTGLVVVQFMLLIAAFTGARYAIGRVPPPLLRRATHALSASVVALGGSALALHVWS